MSSFLEVFVSLVDDSDGTLVILVYLISQGYEAKPAKVYQDNESTIAMIESGRSNSERTRQIAARCFFVEDRVRSKEIQLEYMATKDMTADLLTKPIQGKLFKTLRDQLMIAKSDS